MKKKMVLLLQDISYCIGRRYRYMVFCEFLEFLVRLADVYYKEGGIEERLASLLKQILSSYNLNFYRSMLEK